MSTNKLYREGPKEKVLVYGSGGMLGTRIRELLSEKYKIIGPPHSHLDLTSKRQVLNNLCDVMPDQIIYAAGITKVDYAQQHPKEAFALNASVVAYICKHSARFGIPFHYISTDAVFDGRNCQKPYQENDKTNPLSIYGKSKLEGEQAVLKLAKNNSVIRTIMIYSANYPHRKDFTRAAYESLKNKIPFAGITDQKINPTFVDHLVWAIFKILEARARGIYHVAAIDATTNYQFVVKIANTFGFDKKLVREVNFKDFFEGKPAPRTQCSVLDTVKFRKKFGLNALHTIDQGILEFKKQVDKLETIPIDI